MIVLLAAPQPGGLSNTQNKGLQMKKLLLSLLVLSLAVIGAENDDKHVIELAEGYKLSYGADIRARWEAFDRAVLNPDIPADTHPAMQYLRVRTRAWLALDIYDSLTINLRLNNRFHKVSSSPADPNDQDAGTWEFPDEVILDLANVVYRFNENISLTLGRQTVMFGNGMIFAEGTPFDQGRGSYNDGAVLKIEEKDFYSLSVFVLYDEWKDRTVFINDRNRRLRSNDTLTAGGYFTIICTDWLSLDLYKIFQYIHDKHPLVAERNFAADTSATIFTEGILARFTPLNFLEYSLEAAYQSGKDDRKDHLQAYMVDTRLNLKAPEDTFAKPVFGLEYTFFSGDKPGSNKYEGWIPVFSQCPLWSEELIPIMIDGNWTNLHSFRASLSGAPLPSTNVIFAATKYIADEMSGLNRSNDGNDMGTLLSAEAAYKFNDHLSFLFQLSHFNPGDYFANGHKSFWGRFEVLYTF